MKAALMVAAGWMLSGAVVQGAEREFDDIVRAISDQLHARPMHIPFLGLVNLATFVARPEGMKHVDLAVFEGLNLDDRAVRDIVKLMRDTDTGWRPFVQVRSGKHGHDETVLVYMAPDARDCRLLVISLEPGEATLVEVRLNPEGLQVWMNDPGDTALHHSNGP
jgi:hypothetical protein